MTPRALPAFASATGWISGIVHGCARACPLTPILNASGLGLGSVANGEARDGEAVVGLGLLPGRDVDLAESVGEIALAILKYGAKAWDIGHGRRLRMMRAQGAEIIVLWVLEPNSRPSDLSTTGSE